MSWKSKLVGVSLPAIRHLHGAFTLFSRGNLQPPIDRASFLASLPIGPSLEIGPFDAPLLQGRHVKYFDLLDQENLRLRAVEHGRNPDGCPHIDYVSPLGNVQIVKDSFAVVLSSHVIEHQPDFVRHLNDVSAILLPGGSYYLIIPDRRFCFDHYLPDSTYEDVIEASGRNVHTPDAVEKHLLHTTHNDPLHHWFGRHGAKPTRQMSDKVVAECQRASNGEYVDVHAWFFTPATFSAIVRTLKERGLISLSIERVHTTAFGSIEFFAVLRKF